MTALCAILAAAAGVALLWLGFYTVVGAVGAVTLLVLYSFQRIFKRD